jgi:hypothetical protein
MDSEEIPWDENPKNPKYYYEMVPKDRNPSWGDFFAWLGEYYTHGEYGVIYSDKRTPYQLIKVLNCDITDGDSNAAQAEFFEENWNRNIEGLVKIYSFTRCKAKSGIMNPVQNKVAATNANYVEVMRVLDMDIGDELAMWVMEKANYVGLTHPDLTKDEMIDRVAHAAYSIGTRTGYGIGDLKEPNYGFRQDGSAFIFDFNYQEEEFTLDEYRDKVRMAAGNNTKV